MRALITGITGFGGGHLAQALLKSGDEVFGITRSSDKAPHHLSSRIELTTLDLRNAEDVNEAIIRIKPDVIYHLAAQAFVPTAWADPWATLENNILAQLNILQTMVEQKSSARLMVIASDQVYGLVQAEDLPVDETTTMRPNNPYGVSKVTQDALGLQYYLSHGLDIIRVRTFNHIGPRQSPFFVAANFARQIAEIEAGLLEPKVKVGNLEAKRDFTDVYDVMQAYLLLAEHGKSGEAYNVGTGKAYSIRHLLDALLSYSTVEIEVRKDPERMRPADVPIIYTDNRKLKETTNWTPIYTFEQSLERVLDYWRNEIRKNHAF